MAYGILKVDTITFTDGGVDKSVPVSGLVLNPTFTGNVTVTGTISGNIIQGGTTVSGLTVTGTTANFASGVFTTQISGVTITGTTVAATTGTFTSLTGTTTNGTTASFTTGNFTSLTGTTTTGTTANFASGVFTTQVSGLLITGPTVSATTGTFTSLTGTTTTGTTANFASGVFTTQISGVTITGTTVSTTTGNFTSLTGTTATITSGIIASGTAALPSLAILSDPNTGIYSPGADQLAVATNGVERVKFGTTATEVVFNDGGVDYDFRVESDLESQLFSIDASDNSIGLGASGNYGDGVLTVAALARANGAGTTNVRLGISVLELTSGQGRGLWLGARTDENTGVIGTRTASGNLAFETYNGSWGERMRLTYDGRLGIGTSSPANPLHIRNDAGTPQIKLDYLGSSSTIYGSSDLFLQPNGATAMTLKSGGNVGIGTTGPSGRLDVETASDTYINFSTSNNGSAAGICLLGNNNNEFFGYANNLRFATVTGKNAAGFNERMRMDSSGRLLIGTTSALVDGFNNAFTSSQLSKGSADDFRCISDTRSVAAVNNSTVDVWVVRTAAGNPFNNGLAGHFYVQVGGANAFSGVYSIVTTGNGTSSATLTAVSTVTRGTSPVSSVQIANDGANGAIKLTITYINNAGVVDGLTSYVSFIGLAAP
jgi:hypothetical protein